MSRMRRIGRKPAVRSPAARIVVATEGKVTEPEYLRAFNRLYENPSAQIALIPVGGDPRTVVERAIEEKEKSKHDPLAKHDTYWAMFDRDSHPRYEEARNLARGNGILLATSNPCFELWGVLHYQEQNAPIDRRECQRKLEKLCPGYNASGGKTFSDRQTIGQRYPKAVERSSDSLRRRENEGSPGGNPSTTVHQLTEFIRCFNTAE